MFKILLPVAVCLGLSIAYVDSRPNWDDAGITAFALLLSCGVLGTLGPEPPVALGIGSWGVDSCVRDRLFPQFRIIAGARLCVCGGLRGDGRTQSLRAGEDGRAPSMTAFAHRQMGEGVGTFCCACVSRPCRCSIRLRKVSSNVFSAANSRARRRHRGQRLAVGMQTREGVCQGRNVIHRHSDSRRNPPQQAGERLVFIADDRHAAGHRFDVSTRGIALPVAANEDIDLSLHERKQLVGEIEHAGHPDAVFYAQRTDLLPHRRRPAPRRRRWSSRTALGVV